MLCLVLEKFEEKYEGKNKEEMKKKKRKSEEKKSLKSIIYHFLNLFHLLRLNNFKIYKFLMNYNYIWFHFIFFMMKPNMIKYIYIFFLNTFRKSNITLNFKNFRNCFQVYNVFILLIRIPIFCIRFSIFFKIRNASVILF